MPGPTPALNAIIVCDTLIKDRDSNKRSLIGIFTHLAAPSFPAVHARLSIFARVIDAEGNYAIRIELVRLATMQIIGEGEAEVAIQDRLRYHELTFILNGLRFPAAGRYEFRLYADGVFLGHQAFEVTGPDTEQAQQG